MQMDRVLILAEVAQLEDIALAQLQASNRPVGAGLVVDIPSLAIDLPEAMRRAPVQADRYRTSPLEVEFDGFRTSHVRLGHRVGWQRRRPLTRTLGAGLRAEGRKAQWAITQR